METNPRDGGLDRRIMHNIHFQARRMARSRLRAGMEVEDYEQELLVDLLHRRKSFDPARASFGTFADRIVAHRVCTLAQLTLRAEAERRLISLDATPEHLDDNDDPRTIRAKMTGQILTLDETLHDTLPALLVLLDALPADSPFAQLDPPQRRQRTARKVSGLDLRSKS